ncbi:hypothetical protein [Mesorhizobium sp. B2-3-4]|uniref:hypothetical protein n=1 Tax=Mesorhizobium sp. B2-3-4 TaxID=2589959 RepID=UPI00112EE79C|nr:hypothetical protein [Mesorhizobium sp. B2-3-4]TPM41537.1 hypothetical protein FJ967_00970 [Mesorhizobium sp. B2-3-4]
MTSKADEFPQAYPSGRLPKTLWSRWQQSVREDIEVGADDDLAIKAFRCLHLHKPFRTHASTLLLTKVEYSPGTLTVEGIDYDEATAMYDWSTDQ